METLQFSFNRYIPVIFLFLIFNQQLHSDVFPDLVICIESISVILSIIRVNDIETDIIHQFLMACYNLQASTPTNVNEARKIAFEKPLKIQRMLSVSLVKIDGSSMSLTRI